MLFRFLTQVCLFPNIWSHFCFKEVLLGFMEMIFLPLNNPICFQQRATQPQCCRPKGTEEEREASSGEGEKGAKRKGEKGK